MSIRNLKKIRRFLQKIEVFKCLKNVLSLKMSKLTARPLYNKKHVRIDIYYNTIYIYKTFDGVCNIAKKCHFCFDFTQNLNKILI